MQKVYLVCGVPGSGKTWVCSQLQDRFTYVPNDDYIGGDYVKELYRAARSSEKPILGDCPFAERMVRDKLIGLGIDLVPVFIVEPAQVVKKRYEEREGKPCPTQHLTRAMNIKERAEIWRAPFGTSSEVLDILKEFSNASV